MMLACKPLHMLCSQMPPQQYVGVRAQLWRELRTRCAALPGDITELPHAALVLMDAAACAGVLQLPLKFEEQQAQPASLEQAMQQLQLQEAQLPGEGARREPAAASDRPHSSPPTVVPSALQLLPLSLAVAACTSVAAAALGSLSKKRSAQEKGSVHPPNDTDIAAAFGVNCHLMAAAGDTLRRCCPAACSHPVTAAEVLALFLRVLQAGQQERCVPPACLIGKARELLDALPELSSAACVHPSEAAALLVVAGRTAHGLYPTWPKTLQVLTESGPPKASAHVEMLQQLILAVTAHQPPAS